MATGSQPVTDTRRRGRARQFLLIATAPDALRCWLCVPPGAPARATERPNFFALRRCRRAVIPLCAPQP